jgi:hypothetical protein
MILVVTNSYRMQDGHCAGYHTSFMFEGADEI